MRIFTSYVTLVAFLLQTLLALRLPVCAFINHNVRLHDRRTIAFLGATPASKEVETFRKADFIAAVSEKTGMNKKESEAALMAVLNIITQQVAEGKKVTIPSFGTFSLKERAARKGRNPQTGEPLDIAASKSPSFTAAKAWKDAVNSKS